MKVGNVIYCTDTVATYNVIFFINIFFKRAHSTARKKKACAFLSVTPIRRFAVAEQNNNNTEDS